MDDITVGERIMIYRKRAGLTKKELAAFLDVSPATISRYENDEVYPSVQALIDLSYVFNVSMMKIVAGFGEPNDKEVVVKNSDENLTEEQKKQKEEQRKKDIEIWLAMREKFDDDKDDNKDKDTQNIDNTKK